MNKQELTDAVATKMRIPKAAAEEAITAFLDTVTKAVVKGDAVQLMGSGRSAPVRGQHEMVAIRRPESRFRSPPLKQSSSPPAKHLKTR